MNGKGVGGAAYGMGAFCTHASRLSSKLSSVIGKGVE